MMRPIIMIAVAVGVGVALATTACGEDENPNPNASRVRQEPGSTLSASFANQCSRCHGDRGEGRDVAGTLYPVIPGGKDESAFIAIVRSGRNDMPAFDATLITDADLKADYVWLTTKR